MKTQITNLQSPESNKPVANQFLISSDRYNIFKSYETIIAKEDKKTNKITLDKKWNYSRTTIFYLCEFLPHYSDTEYFGKALGKREIEDRIAQGIYNISNLN